MTSSFKGSDDTHWSTTYESSSGQVNDLSGKVDSSDHCHYWKETSGSSGVEHRGHCKVCDDQKSGGK